MMNFLDEDKYGIAKLIPTPCVVICNCKLNVKRINNLLKVDN